MITYSNGKQEDINKVVDLCSTWWEDSSFYKNTKMVYNPDIPLFNQLWRQNLLFFIVGKNESEEVVSCYVSVISPHLFNPSYTMASEIVWCLREDYRKGKEVFKLINKAEEGLKERGVDIYNLNLPIPEDKQSLAEYLTTKKGFFLQDFNMMKEI